MPLLRRRCPKCGTKVGWVRFWLKPWIWERWPCPGCGVTLRFDAGRRLLMGLLAIAGFALAVAVGPPLGQLLGAPPAWAAAAVAFLIGLLVLLLDAVKLA